MQYFYVDSSSNMSPMDHLIGSRARLPHGQRVTIEEINGDLAVVRRMEEPQKESIAICYVTSLLLEDGSPLMKDDQE